MFEWFRTLLILQVLVLVLTAVNLSQSSIEMLGVRALDLILEGFITYALYKVCSQDFDWYPTLMTLVGCGIALDGYISYLTQDWSSLILILGVMIIVVVNRPEV